MIEQFPSKSPIEIKGPSYVKGAFWEIALWAPMVYSQAPWIDQNVLNGN